MSDSSTSGSRSIDSRRLTTITEQPERSRSPTPPPPPPIPSQHQNVYIHSRPQPRTMSRQDHYSPPLPRDPWPGESEEYLTEVRAQDAITREKAKQQWIKDKKKELKSNSSSPRRRLKKDKSPSCVVL